MSITAKVQIEHERLALVPTLRKLDGVEIRVISQGTTDPGSTVFPFLIEYDDRTELERSLDTDPTVSEYDLVEWTDEKGIYYIEHTEETEFISVVVTEVNGFLAHTETNGTGWLAKLHLPDREALRTIWEYASEYDITLDILEIYGNEHAGSEGSYGLTDEQKAALNTAYEKGYFSEPREISLYDVANEMDLSSTAMSGRLRRGMRNLIDATIAETEKED